ncbi:nucleoplasmin-like isoform X2 [Hemicordylus capensis]|nr:nucleoplasmin-like isoform X2 [Hemicordylus capensis]
MSSVSSLSSSENQRTAILWGCELNSRVKSLVKAKDGIWEQIVCLRTVSLGEEASDELHVVAIESQNMAAALKPMPIVSLRHSVLPMVNMESFEFIPPVAFILKSGTGPVYLSGKNLTPFGENYPSYDTSDEDAVEAGEEEPDEVLDDPDYENENNIAPEMEAVGPSKAT